MKELIYPFHTQAEDRHCFLLLSCVCLWASPAAGQGDPVQVTPDTISNGSYRWIPRCWPWSVFLYFGKRINRHSQLSLWGVCLLSFLLPRGSSVQQASLRVGFFAFLESLPYLSSLTAFPDLFYLLFCLCVNKTQIFTQSYNGRFLFWTQVNSCLRNHFIFFYINALNLEQYVWSI